MVVNKDLSTISKWALHCVPRQVNEQTIYFYFYYYYPRWGLDEEGYGQTAINDKDNSNGNGKKGENMNLWMAINDKDWTALTRGGRLR